MRKNRLKTVLTVLILLAVALYSIAQNRVPVSVFPVGQGIPNDASTMSIYSLVGQDAVGLSKNDSMAVRSGYLGLTTVQTAIINDPPVIISSSVDTAYKDQSYKYKAIATDPDNKSLFFSFHNLPNEFVGQGDSVFSFHVPHSADTSFTVIVSDGTLYDTLVVTLVVSLQVKPFAITSPVLDTAVEDEKYVYMPSSNYDNDPDVTIEYDFRYSYYPSWLSPVIGTSGIMTLVGTPLEGDTSTSFIVKAINLADSTVPLDMKQVALTVQGVNDAPALTLPTSLSAVAGQEFQYQVVAEDVDDTVLTYSLLRNPAGMSVGVTGLLQSWIPSESLIGTVDTVVVRVRDPLGAADTGSFAISIIAEGTPYCSNVGPIDTVSRDSIAIPFVLVDKDFDTLSISIKYYLSNGSSAVPTTLIGKTTGLDTSSYSGTLVWASRDDFSDTLVDSVLIEVIPGDGVNTGPPFRTDWFSINNTAALTVSSVTPLSTDTVTGYYGRYITVTFAGPAVDTATLDQTTLLINGSVGGPMAYTMTKSATAAQCLLNGFPYGAENITVVVSGAIRDINNKTLDGNGNGLFEGAGVDDDTSFFTIAKLGDFDRDDTIGGAVELSYLSAYWNGSMAGSITADSIFKVETGPAAGTPPYMKVTPDSAFNFEDLCVYLQMWYWYVKSDNAVVRGTFAEKVPSERYQLKLKSKGTDYDVVPPDMTYADYDSETAVQQVTVRHESGGGLILCMDVKNVSGLVACEYRIFYDEKQLSYSEPGDATMLEDESGDALILDGSVEGLVNLTMARLSSASPSVSGDGRVASLHFQKLGRIDNLVIQYKLVNSSHAIIESGIIPLAADELNPEAAQDIKPVTGLTVTPNPFTAAATASILDITDNISLLQRSAERGGGAVITFTVPAGFRSNTLLSTTGKIDVMIAVFDPLGNTVIKTSQQTIFPQPWIGLDGEQFGIYWNGTNANNRRVERGIYKVILQWKTDKKSGGLTSLIGVKE